MSPQANDTASHPDPALERALQVAHVSGADVATHANAIERQVRKLEERLHLRPSPSQA